MHSIRMPAAGGSLRTSSKTKGVESWLLVAIAANLALGLFAPPSARAQDDVSDCTEQALLTAMSSAIADGTGYVPFDEDCTINLTGTIEIGSASTNAASGMLILDSKGFNVQIVGSTNIPIFQIDSGAGVMLIGITMSGGESTNGGAMFIHKGASVVLTNCVLTGNSAFGTNGQWGLDAVNSGSGNGNSGLNAQPGSDGMGGAIFNLGNLQVINSTIGTNTVVGGHGGRGGSGGNGGTAFSRGGNGGTGAAGGNAWGGGIFNSGPSLLLSNCIIAGNSAIGGNGGLGGSNGVGYTPGLQGSGGVGGVGYGAGIYSHTPIRVINCTFVGNTATGGDTAAAGNLVNGNGINALPGGNSAGGGLCALDGGRMTNCTFCRNTATGGAGGTGGSARLNAGKGGEGGIGTGGGLYAAGLMPVVNCTFSSCGAFGGTAGSAGTGAYPATNGLPGPSRGGNIVSGTGGVMLRGSIIGMCPSGYGGVGTFIDGGYNISADFSIKLGPNSEMGVLPPLSSLADNGGLTPTMAIVTPSPAMNRVPAKLCPLTDQRGVPRPANGNTGDVGAFELVVRPVILQAPQNVVQTYTGPATFTVQAIGDERSGVNDTLSYQWQLDTGEELTNTFNNNTVTILSATNTDGYHVVAIVTDRYGSVTSSPPAVVEYPPYFTQPFPTNALIPAGSNVTLTAFAAATTNLPFAVPPGSSNFVSPILYQWQTNGVSLLGATNSSYNVFGNTNNALDYTIVISNYFGAITSTPCIVVVGPSIYLQPQGQTASANQQVSLTVGATGTAPLTYTWYMVGNPTPVAAGSTYTFIASSSASYYVVVANQAGSVQSQTASVVVSTAVPTIILQPTNQTVAAGANAAFFVLAQGGGISYQWFEMVNGSANILAGRTNASLLFPNVQTNNAGTYFVEVQNSLGGVLSSNATLTVQAGLSSVMITSVSVASNTLTLVYSGQANHTYLVQFKAALDAPDWSPLSTNVPVADGPCIFLDPTTNGTTRFYRILAN